MALEVVQGLRMNESDHLRVELGQESEASSATLALGQNSQAPQDTVLELQGDTQALQESNSKCEELMKENGQLREQVAKLEIQLRIEKDTSEDLRSLKEKHEGDLEQMLNLVESQTLPRSPQGAKEKQLEELGEQQKQLTEVQEAGLREQETKACGRLRQEVARLTSWTEKLQAEQEELVTKNQELQASLENKQQNFQILQNLYHMMMEEQRSKEIALTKLTAQCESLTRYRKDLEEERRQLWRQIDSLKELNQTLLEERVGTWPLNKKKSGSRGVGFLRFFQRQRQGSRGQAKSPPESTPGSQEATPACSGWREDRDARSEPRTKATGQQKSAFWSRKKKDKVKDKPPRAGSTLSNLLCFCKK